MLVDESSQPGHLDTDAADENTGHHHSFRRTITPELVSNNPPLYTTPALGFAGMFSLVGSVANGHVKTCGAGNTGAIGYAAMPRIRS